MILLLLLLSCGADEPSSKADTSISSGCLDPAPVMDPAGNPTGFVRCADGSLNRVAVVPANVALYEASVTRCPAGRASEYDTCRVDDDCGAAANGRCRINSHEYGSHCACTYLCATDAECGPGFACIPPIEERGWPICSLAACSTGADCASGECGLSDSRSLACRSRADECRVLEDCAGCELCSPSEDLFRCVIDPACYRD